MALSLPPERVAVAKADALRLPWLPLQRLLLGSMLALLVIVGWKARTKIELFSGDELTYIELSQALERGSYREVYRPSEPLHVKYPPGYPAWLVIVRTLTGNHIELIPAANLAVVSAALLLLVSVARRLRDNWFAVAMLAPIVLNHGVIWMGDSYYSEGFYLLVTMGALYATVRADEGDRRWCYAAIALAVLSFLTRSVGIAMVAAVGVWLLFNHRRPAIIITHIVASGLAVGGWFGYVLWAQKGQAVRSYLYDFNPEGFERNPFSIFRVIVRVLGSVKEYAAQAMPYEFALPVIPWLRVPSKALWLLVIVVALGVGVVLLWKRWRAAAVYLVAYAGVLATFPYTPPRLLDPIVPLTYLTILLGAWKLAERLPARANMASRVVLLALLVFGAARSAAGRVRGMSTCDRSDPYRNGGGCYDRRTVSLIDASRVIAAQSDSTDFVLAWRATTVHFISERLTESALVAEQVPLGEFGASLRARRIRFVVLTSMHLFERRQLADQLIASCMELRLVQTFDTGTILLETKPWTTPEESACAALTVYRREHPRPYIPVFDGPIPPADGRG